MYLVTSEQMRCFDHHTIETCKVPAIVLMDHAGKSVAEAVAEYGVSSIVIACGKGNNGGDGWLAARWLRHMGYAVRVVSAVDPDTELSNDAHRAFEMAVAVGVPWQCYTEGCLAEMKPAVYVDALLGTGCTRALAGKWASMVREMNETKAPIVAVDIPTGVNASTGEVYDVAVQATETIAMAFEKLGTAVTPGANHAGQVRVVDIGITAPLPEGMAVYVDPRSHGQGWGERGVLSHKGTYGRCGIVVGQMQGAAMLAAAGAARAGAGLVVLSCDELVSPAVAPDYVVRKEADPLVALADCQSVVIGPGLGKGQALVRKALTASKADTMRSWRGVIDADGLADLIEEGQLLQIGDEWVLTPHPKECALLLGWTTAQVQAKRISAATQLAAQTGAIVLLKGYRTVIARPDGQIRINPTGNASLAVGGSGDLLAGIIGSLIAQGLNGFAAASLGAWLHGRAGELAGAALTPVSTTASDIEKYISRAIMTFFDIVQAEL
ncbi:NAD(P)H-hydrate dehydratase [Alicyclobacillus fodiniaquatilis]|uniref:Bifunctional NAD(P)H-hydrate repair enzyme n=1 Tax=Alicyclobacillus fodiniaquatilis TaxID=1661150 RepID=A0ABW4JJP0_9BACL